MKTMKIMKRLMGCAAAILALTACSESEDLLAAYHSDSKAVHITAQVGKASADGFTRSNPLGDAKKQTEFNENDEISVQADGQSAVTYQFNGSEWLPKESSKFLKWEKETMNFTAYYPATFNGTINQPTEYNKEADLAAADFMSFSGPKTNTNDNKRNQLTLTMNRLMARVVVEIAAFNDQYANATVNSLSICGVKAYKQEKDGKSYFYALIDPKYTSSTAPFLSLEVKDGESTTTETLTTTPTFEAGKSYTYQLKVGKNKISVSGITVADWENTGIITDNGKAEEIPPYITFKADAEQKFKMTTEREYTISELEYSVKDGEWTPVVANTEVPFGGDKGDLRLRGKNPNGTAKDNSNYSNIRFTNEDVKVACTGDIRTLLNWKYYDTVDTKNARFCWLFSRCSVLTSAPELPATTLASYCYYNMFNCCSSLESAPVLPATTLASNCYYEMFYGCTSLTSAPELPAEKLSQECYKYTFRGCTKLSTVTMLASSDQITKRFYCCYSWLDDAGTDPNVTRTIKVQDADAYNALVDKGYLPARWQKGATNTTVLNKNGDEIK